MQSWIDGLRSRCGPLTEAATLFSATQGLESDPPRGVPALATLARAIDRHRHTAADENEDRVFVELAGAFFAATLADCLERGRHVARRGKHRLRLGRFAHFDPFASIERALSSQDTKRCLMREIANAEVAARGEDPCSIVAREALRQLARRHGAVELLDCFDTFLELDVAGQRMALNLERVVSVCEDEGPSAAPSLVRQLLSRLPGAFSSREEAWEDLGARIFPRLLGESFVRSLPASHDLLLRDLGGGAVVALVVRYSDKARYLRRGELGPLGVAPGVATQRALANLADRSERARFSRVVTVDGPLVTAHSGDGLDSSRLLLPGLHDVLAAELGSPLLVAIPNRDALYAVACGGPAALALSRRAQSEASRARYSITDRLFRLEPGGRLSVVSD